MELRTLHYFLTVAREQSISAAAEHVTAASSPTSTLAVAVPSVPSLTATASSSTRS